MEGSPVLRSYLVIWVIKFLNLDANLQISGIMTFLINIPVFIFAFKIIKKICNQ